MRAEPQRETSAIFKWLMEQAPVGVAFLDPQFRYVYVNQKLAEINGVPAQEHVGKTLREVAPAIHDQALPGMQSAMWTLNPVSDRLIIGATPASRGEWHYWKQTCYPVRNPSGEVIGVGVIIEDVTHLIDAERKRRKETQCGH